MNGVSTPITKSTIENFNGGVNFDVMQFKSQMNPDNLTHTPLINFDKYQNQNLRDL